MGGGGSGRKCDHPEGSEEPQAARSSFKRRGRARRSRLARNQEMPVRFLQSSDWRSIQGPLALSEEGLPECGHGVLQLSYLPPFVCKHVQQERGGYRHFKGTTLAFRCESDDALLAHESCRQGECCSLALRWR